MRIAHLLFLTLFIFVGSEIKAAKPGEVYKTMTVSRGFVFTGTDDELGDTLTYTRCSRGQGKARIYITRTIDSRLKNPGVKPEVILVVGQIGTIWRPDPRVQALKLRLVRVDANCTAVIEYIE